MAHSEVRVKAFVLLSEEEYLKENVKNPGCYFVSLRKHNILTEEQYQELRTISDFKARMVKLVELVSAHPKGFDVFCTLARKNREDNHVSSFLKRKLSEHSFLMEECLSSSAGLSVNQQHHLKLLEFLERAKTTHELARDILASKNWDVTESLVVAKEMGLCEDVHTIVCTEYDSPRSSSGYSIEDSGEFEDYSSLSSSGTESVSTRFSSGDRPLNSHAGVGDSHTDEGPLPAVPRRMTPSPISPETNDVHPKYGPMPKPFSFSWRDEESGGQQVVVDPAHSAPPSTAIASVPEKKGEDIGPLPVASNKVERPTTLPTGTTTAGQGGRTRHAAGRDRSDQRKPQAGNRPGPVGRSVSSHKLEVVSQPEVKHPSPPELSHQRAVQRDGMRPSKPSPMALLGNYWVCYHCHEKNSKEEVMCKLCEMLSCYTHPCWDVDDDASNNYVCRECTLAVRLPCEPCPATLISCLKRAELCNKCYRAACRSTPLQTRPPLSASLLDSKPTFLKLKSIPEGNGAYINITDEVASRWDTLAPHLDISHNYIKILHRDFPSQCQNASLRMFSMWVDKPNVTWKMLLDALRSINEDVLALRIEQACNYDLLQEQSY